MPEPAYAGLALAREGGVAVVTLDHPPLNLLDAALLSDLDRLGHELAALAADGEVRAVVFQSADPEYFLAHADVSLIQRLPAEAPPRSEELSFFHGLVERFRTLPAVTIGVLEGRARGGGSELLLSLDLRFGAIGRAVLSQPEVALGIIPGGSGTQRLARLVGRARALEAILGCEDFDAELAERYGWINRALPAALVRPFAHRLARRIAGFPPQAVALAKRAVDAADRTLREGLLEEAHLFSESVATPDARARMARFLECGGQDREQERHLDRLLARLADDA